MAGDSPLCLAGWLIGFGKETDRMLAGCWLVGGSLFFYCNIETKNFFLAVDWLHGWRLPSLLSWSLVGWLVLAKRLTECWLTVVGGWFGVFYCKIETIKLTFFLAVDWLHGWRLPSLLSWSVDWFWQRGWQSGGWLLIGGWTVFFLMQNWD